MGEDTILLIKRIESELREMMKQMDVEIMQSFPSLLAYDLMKGNKLYLSHDFDPPWDQSGTLFSCSPKESFHVANYDKVADFFIEYTGNSVATFISHHGLFYETYEEKYFKWFVEKYQHVHADYFTKLEDEVLNSLATDIYGKNYLGNNDMEINDLINGLIDEIEEFADMSFDYAEIICSKISMMDLLLVYKLGEQEATERVVQEQIERKKAEKQMRDEKEAFLKRWQILENKYRLVFQKPFPKSIEMPDFENFKYFLDQHHVSEEERVLIAKYAPISFSNRVIDKLIDANK